MTESSLFFTLQLMVADSPSITVTLSVARFWSSAARHKGEHSDGKGKNIFYRDRGAEIDSLSNIVIPQDAIADVCL